MLRNEASNPRIDRIAMVREMCRRSVRFRQRMFKRIRETYSPSSCVTFERRLRESARRIWRRTIGLHRPERRNYCKTVPAVLQMVAAKMQRAEPQDWGLEGATRY